MQNKSANKARNARPRKPCWPGLSLLRSASPFAWRYLFEGLMRNILFAIITVFTLPAWGESTTLNVKEITGVWNTHHGYGAKPVNVTERTLTIVPGGQTVLHSRYPSGSESAVYAVTDQFQYVDDFAIISFKPNSDNFSAKLVLSGWEHSDEKLIFGNIYMYKDGEMFNGIPMSFIQKSR